MKKIGILKDMEEGNFIVEFSDGACGLFVDGVLTQVGSLNEMRNLIEKTSPSGMAKSNTEKILHSLKKIITHVFGSIENMYETVTVTEDGEYTIPERFFNKNIDVKTKTYNKIVFSCWFIKNYNSLNTVLNGFSVPEICVYILDEYTHEKLVKPHLFYNFISSWIMENADWVANLKGIYDNRLMIVAKKIVSTLNKLPN